MTTPAISPTQRSAYQSLKDLIEAILADPSSAFGYSLAAVSVGETVDVTLEKGGATFRLWLKPATDPARFYRRTVRFKIGYSGDPPDPLGFKLLDAVCTRVQMWERSQANSLHSQPVEQVSAPVAGAATELAAQAVAQTSFSPIYEDWLPVRQRQLAASFAKLTIDSEKHILLVNATKGLQFYASIADYFALLQRTHSRVRVTGASYFDEIAEFHEGVASKALAVTSARQVMTWSAAELNRFDTVLLIGASDVMLKLMALEGLTAKLVLLDLGFYHQLLDSYPDWWPGIAAKDESRTIGNPASQMNRVVVYSCQPEVKVKRDLTGVCAPDLLEWRWFNYIPIGFSYCTYYRASRCAFDVALLGTDRREYEQIDPALFRGVRFLFLGAADKAPAIGRLQGHLPVTVVSRVDEDTYARLLAMCHCVVLPHRGSYVENVFMSVVDTVAAGKALVTPRHPGIARLEDESLPVAFYDATPADLFRQVSALLGDEHRRRDIEAGSIEFAKEKLDIYRILGTILDEQVL